MARADVVIAAWGAGQYQVSKDDMKAALKARRRRPVMLFDLSVPPDLDPAIDELDDAFLYRLEDRKNARQRPKQPGRCSSVNLP